MLASPTGYAMQNPNIPEAATVFNGHSYHIYTERMSWDEARAKCEQLGGHLAVITSKEEQEFLESVLIPDNWNMWLGGSKTSEGNWKWVTDEEWDYTNWNEGEPNNSGGEDKLCTFPFGWNDLRNDSSEIEGYICEWEETRYRPTTGDATATHAMQNPNIPEKQPVSLNDLQIKDCEHIYQKDEAHCTDYHKLHTYPVAQVTGIDASLNPCCTFILNEQYSELSGTLYISSRAGNSIKGKVCFYFDDVLAWESNEITNEPNSEDFVIDVTGVRELKVTASNSGNWADGFMGMYSCLKGTTPTDANRIIPIPDDAFEYNGHYYKVYDTGYVWDEAKAFCESLGGHLATITSAEEQKIAESALSAGTKKSYWLGARKEQDKYQWITGETWEYTNWARLEPNNNQDSGGEDCLMIYNAQYNSNSASGQWNDINNQAICGDRDFYGLKNFGLLCEWDGNETEKAVSIPEDAFEFSGHSYKVYDTGYTWEDAAEFCESMGGHLVTITSADEQDAVKSALVSGTRNSYWLGARSISGDYRWVTGEEWSYSNWAYRQPDNHSKSGGEDCLMLYNAENPYASCSVGEWNDINNLGTCGSEDFFGIENFGYL